MPFVRQLKTEAYSPWRQNYINYAHLTRLIRGIYTNNSHVLDVDGPVLYTQLKSINVTDAVVRVVEDDDYDEENEEVTPDDESKTYTDRECEILGLTQRKIPKSPNSQSPQPTLTMSPRVPAESDYEDDDDEDEDDDDGKKVKKLKSEKRKMKGFSESPDSSSSSSSSSKSPSATLTLTMGPTAKNLSKMVTATGGATQDEIEEFLKEFEAERARVASFFDAEVQLVEVKINTAESMIRRKQQTQSDYTDSYIKKTLFDALDICEELVDYSCLNLVGFTKIIRKLEKYTQFPHGKSLLKYVEKSSFVASLAHVTELGKAAKRVYGAGFPGEEAVLTQSVEAARSWKRNTILNEFDMHTKKAIIKPAGRRPLWPVALALMVLMIFLFVPIFSRDTRPAQRCLGVLLASVILWVSECWPLFVTALLVPLFVILSNVMLNAEGTLMGASDTAKAIFSQMFPSNIPLILAGFSVAQAFGKYHLDVKIVMFILKRPFWRTPARFALAVELLCFVMTMWISNVAATALLMTITMPVIRGLPKSSNYPKTLLMAISLAANIGGITTQISSPQNAVSASLKEYTVNFIDFTCIAFPVCPFLLIIGHILLMSFFKPDIDELPDLGFDDSEMNPVAEAASIIIAKRREDDQQQQQQQGNEPSLRAKQAAVVTISLVAVGLWASSPWLAIFADNIGIISLFPLVAFYGLGLLSTEDFLCMPWNLVILIGGGNVLGEAVESSKLLEMTGELILRLPSNIYLISAVSCLLMLVAGSFISHTVAALILLRLFGKIGEALGHPKLIIMTTVVMCGGAMPLPISSIPNMNLCSLAREDGTPILNTIDFVKLGLPCTLLAYVGCNSITYWMAMLLGL